MADRGSTGSRIRAFRWRRGLTQAQLGGLVDKSERWVREVESGQQEVSHFRTLVRIAEVLHVRPGDLLVSPLTLAPNGLRVHEVMADIRRALLPFALVEEEAVPLDALRRDIDAGWRASQGYRHRELGAELPRLIARGRAAVEQSEGHDREIAHGLLAHIMCLATRVAEVLGDMEDAALASGQGMIAAQQSGDPLDAALSACRIATPLMRAGRDADARDCCTGAAMRIAALTGKEADSVQGSLLLMASVAAARQGDAGGARAALAEAHGAALRLDGEQRNDLWTAFGSANVALHEVSVAVELGEFGIALERAGHVDVSLFPAELAGRRSRLYVEQARCYAAERKDEAAIASLLQADSIAPEAVRWQSLTRDMVRAIIRRRRSASSIPGAARLAERMGISAV